MPTLPHAADAEGFLLFSLCWAVQRRHLERQAWRIKTSHVIEEVRAAKLARGDRLIFMEILRPNPYESALRGRTPAHNHAENWRGARSSSVTLPVTEVPIEYRLAGVASWLFLHLHDTFFFDYWRDAPHPALSPVCQLRVCSKAWRDRLPGFVCCDCGDIRWPLFFRAGWSLRKVTCYGAVECSSCCSWQVDHLSCLLCTERVQEHTSDSDHTSDCDSEFRDL